MEGIGKLHLFFILFCLSFAPVGLRAQVIERSTDDSDFQTYTGFSIDKQIIKGLHLTWSEELRMKSSTTEIDRIHSVIAASYDLFSWFRIGADYTFITVDRGDQWQFRNRSNLDATFSYRLSKRWKFSLRERFRVTSANKDIDPLTEVNPTWIMRSRLMAEYSAECLPLKPYLYFELSNTLNTPTVVDNYIDKIRVSAGVKYAISPRSEFDLYYRFDRNWSKSLDWPVGGMPWIITTEKDNNHIIGLFYEYSF